MNIEGIVPKELLRHIVDNGIDKLNLVSREEFEIQTKVLERAREKLERLTKQVSEIEQTLKS